MKELVGTFNQEKTLVGAFSRGLLRDCKTWRNLRQLRFELYSAGCCGDEVAVESGCMLGSVWPGLGWGATIVCPQSGETPGPGH